MPASGKLSKWSLTGDDMAESVSIKEEMTSGEAGLTETWFEDRRISFRGLTGKERRLRSLELGLFVFGVEVVEGNREVRAEVLKGIAGPWLLVGAVVGVVVDVVEGEAEALVMAAVPLKLIAKRQRNIH